MFLFMFMFMFLFMFMLWSFFRSCLIHVHIHAHLHLHVACTWKWPWTWIWTSAEALTETWMDTNTDMDIQRFGCQISAISHKLTLITVIMPHFALFSPTWELWYHGWARVSNRVPTYEHCPLLPHCLHLSHFWTCVFVSPSPSFFCTHQLLSSWDFWMLWPWPESPKKYVPAQLL